MIAKSVFLDFQSSALPTELSCQPLTAKMRSIGTDKLPETLSPSQAQSVPRMLQVRISVFERVMVGAIDYKGVHESDMPSYYNLCE